MKLAGLIRSSATFTPGRLSVWSVGELVAELLREPGHHSPRANKRTTVQARTGVDVPTRT